MPATIREPKRLTFDPIPATGLPAAPAAGSVFKWRVNVEGYARVRGFAFQEIPDLAVVQVKFYQTPTGLPCFSRVILVDGSGNVPTFTHTWDELVRAPWFELVATNGAVASTSFRAQLELLPTP